MTRRLFYIALGATAGVLLVRRVSVLAESLQPDALTRRLVVAVEEFLDDVREAMHEREAELRDALGLTTEPDSANDPLAASGPPPAATA